MANPKKTPSSGFARAPEGNAGNQAKTPVASSVAVSAASSAASAAELSPGASLLKLLQALDEMPRPRLFAFDVDGTLAPLVTDPDAARVPPSTLESLRKLAELGEPVAMITGRDLEALCRMVPIDGLWRSVDHGLVVLAPGETDAGTLSAEEQHTLDEYAETLRREGARIESKHRSVGVHVRGQEKAEGERILRVARSKARELQLSAREGKFMVEAAFHQGNKADALKDIMARSGAKSAFFVGDDVTDLPAIALAARSGAGAFVLPETSGYGADQLDDDAADGASSLLEERVPKEAHVLRGLSQVAVLLASLASRVASAH